MKLRALVVATLLLAGGGCRGKDDAVAVAEQGDHSAASGTLGDSPALPPLNFARRVPEVGPPQAFALQQPYPTPEDFLRFHAPLLWVLTPRDELRPGRTDAGLNGHSDTTYLQFHAGYPVEGGSIVLTTRGGRVVSCVGDFVGGLDKLSLEVRIPEEAAIQRARERMTIARGIAEDALSLRDTDARLLISEKEKSLVWRVQLEPRNPFETHVVNVDAATGAVLSEWGGTVLRDDDATVE